MLTWFRSRTRQSTTNVCHKVQTLVESLTIFFHVVGGRPKAGEFTKAEGELCGYSSNNFLKHQRPFVAILDEWHKHVDGDQFFYKTNKELQKLKDTAKRSS